MNNEMDTEVDLSDIYSFSSLHTPTRIVFNEELGNIVIPPIRESDLFKNIPNTILDDNRIRRFKDIFNKALAIWGIEGMVLNDFSFSKDSDGVTLELIHNYFRAVIIFDDEGDDMYGMILANYKDRIYNTDFKPLKDDNYSIAALEIIKFIIKHV
jgi:hypothetical protein